MDWGDLAKQVIGLGAPILGAALGGPLGGAAGRILAEAVGATDATPEAVGKALTTSGAGQIMQAENVWAEAVRAETAARLHRARAVTSASRSSHCRVSRRITSDGVSTARSGPRHSMTPIAACW